MQLPPDYHMHTHLCHHADGDAIDLARHALEIGLTEIGVSEHNPMPRDDFDDWRMHLSRLDEYLARVDEARGRYPMVQIRAALEVDYIPGYEDWIRELAARHPWDYFIGSVHYVSDSWDIDNPKKLDQWRGRDVFEVWQVYFDRLTAAAASGLFQIIGHADLPKKFGFVPNEDCTPLFTRFLTTARQHDVAVEINTAGLQKACREMYPSLPFLRLAAAHGVGLTFGSDAHRPEDVGKNFDQAVALARAAGFRTSRHLVCRTHREVPLP